MPANHTPFPLSGNNFTTILCLDDIKDTDALLDALGVQMVLFDFELPITMQNRTDTVDNGLSAGSETVGAAR
jgi:hypothetical protein